MTVQDVLNKHKHCNYWMVINHLGECILETDNLENIDKDILNKEVKVERVWNISLVKHGCC